MTPVRICTWLLAVALAVVLPVRGYAWTDEVLEAAKAVHEVTIADETAKKAAEAAAAAKGKEGFEALEATAQKAKAFAEELRKTKAKQLGTAILHNDAIHEMASEGKLGKTVDESEAIFESCYKEFSAQNEKFTKEAILENGLDYDPQTPMPDAKIHPGKDADLLLKRKSPTGGPITLEQVKKVHATHQQKMRAYLESKGVKVEPGKTLSLKTDFMPVPSETNAKEFKKIVKWTNANGGNMYLNPVAAEVEAKIRLAEKKSIPVDLTLEEADAYAKEMRQQFNKKMYRAKMLEKAVKTASPSNLASLEARIKMERMQAGKYVSRMDKVTEAIARKIPEGAGSSIARIEAIGDVTENAIEQSTRKLLRQVAVLAENTDPKSALAGQCEKLLESHLKSARPSLRGPLLLDLDGLGCKKIAGNLERSLKAAGVSVVGSMEDVHRIRKMAKAVAAELPAPKGQAFLREAAILEKTPLGRQFLSVMADGWEGMSRLDKAGLIISIADGVYQVNQTFQKDGFAAASLKAGNVSADIGLSLASPAYAMFQAAKGVGSLGMELVVLGPVNNMVKDMTYDGVGGFLQSEGITRGELLDRFTTEKNAVDRARDWFNQDGPIVHGLYSTPEPEEVRWAALEAQVRADFRAEEKGRETLKIAKAWSYDPATGVYPSFGFFAKQGMTCGDLLNRYKTRGEAEAAFNQYLEKDWFYTGSEKGAVSIGEARAATLRYLLGLYDKAVLEKQRAEMLAKEKALHGPKATGLVRDTSGNTRPPYPGEEVIYDPETGYYRPAGGPGGAASWGKKPK